ncbi:MAG: TlyA family RNA methyltransferase [Oscillospiraceae bacterium]|nr:TlyA family RNA methyltransferase [Oscillospiraceae bacterium]
MVEKGIASSREKAKEMIKKGDVYLNNQKALKAGLFVNDCDIIEFRGKTECFVSRGGLKLQKAIECFNLNLNGYLCMDVGASTGGFTDCMLQNGASKVYAIDSGTGQLAQSLIEDNRVLNLEKTNFRYADNNLIPELIDFASVDVSFISLKLIFTPLYNLLKDDGTAVCLIKPQFEAGKDKVGKKGVVKEPRIHIEVIKKVCDYANESGFNIIDLNYSPVRGPEGNIEYLLYIQKAKEFVYKELDISKVVSDSHIELRR